MSTKEKVLEILSENISKAVSGEILAEKCGVSRAAIWKAVSALRENGCQIEGSTNGGYVLTKAPDVFSQEKVKEYFQRNFPEYKESTIQCFGQIDSTNTYAKRILSECGNLRNADGSLTQAGKIHHKEIIIAESQTAGRGRLGRTFYSPDKTGIYISLIYAPENGITDPAKITAFTAVAVCRSLKKLYDLKPSIKWINDIYLNGKKICGILAEGFANFETNTIESAIIGIGINIKNNREFFPTAIAKVAGGISEADNINVDRNILAAQVAGEVFNALEENPEQVMKEYKAASFLIGQTIQVHPVIGDTTKFYSAKAIDISDDAGLIVELEDGSHKKLSSGEVSLHSQSF